MVIVYILGKLSKKIHTMPILVYNIQIILNVRMVGIQLGNATFKRGRKTRFKKN